MTSLIDEIKKLLSVQADGSPATPVFKSAIAELERHESEARHLKAAASGHDAELAKLKAEMSGRGMDLVEESVDENNAVRLRVRHWQN